MKIGYIRVSSLDQNLDRQKAALDEYKIEKWYSEKASGKNTADRPVLNEMLDFVREGDIVYVMDFSRLARSVVDLLQIEKRLRDKKVKLVTIKEHVDTATPEGRLMMTVVGAIAEFERTMIRERQAEGIAIARQKGKYAGRKRIVIPDFQVWYEKYKKREITVVQMAEQLKISRATAFRLIKQYKTQINAQK